jgi:hemerythrin superfamily protein
MTTMKQQDLTDAVVADHRGIEAVFDDIEASGDARMRRELVEHAIAELVRHSVAEEMYLYPTAREALPDGDEIADHEIADHAGAEELMKAIERADETDPEFSRLVAELISDVRHHMKSEETELLPRLRTACDAADLLDLGRKFELSKKAAPTRPHPAAPDRPPANKILGPGMGLIDRVRDALSGRNA